MMTDEQLADIRKWLEQASEPCGNDACIGEWAAVHGRALLAEVERLRADAELGRLVREVLPLMAVEPPANHHTALICWGGSGWDVFYACDDWSLPDTAPSTTPEDALRSARENMEQHRMLVGYYPDFRAEVTHTTGDGVFVYRWRRYAAVG